MLIIRRKKSIQGNIMGFIVWKFLYSKAALPFDNM